MEASARASPPVPYAPRGGAAAATGLRELDGLGDDALLGLVVPALDEAREREVLAHRVALEAVVGQDAAQVGVAVEVDACAVGRDRKQRLGIRARLRTAPGATPSLEPRCALGQPRISVGPLGASVQDPFSGRRCRSPYMSKVSRSNQLAALKMSHTLGMPSSPMCPPVSVFTRIRLLWSWLSSW